MTIYNLHTGKFSQNGYFCDSLIHILSFQAYNFYFVNNNLSEKNSLIHKYSLSPVEKSY
jgi:hypothetical protein